ncbi:MAG: hypothetical protein ILO68_05915 [Clostridia bacterium]|nr:hypothetical protein [Clostridia bacterium]
MPEADDQKEANVSTSGLFYAFESIREPDVIYIECGPRNWFVSDYETQSLSDKEIVPLEVLYPDVQTVLSKSKKMFPDKTLKYRIWFDNECAYGGAGRSFSDEELREVRDANLVKLCNVLQIEVEYEQTVTGDSRVKSPELYATEAEIDEICHSGPCYLFYSLTPPDLHRLAKYHPDNLESAKEYLLQTPTNYFWTYYARTGEVVFNETLFQSARRLRDAPEESSELYLRYVRMGEFRTAGKKMKYGESICTDGTPDGEKWSRAFYEQQLAKFGDLVSRYIVNGEFLEEELIADQEKLGEKRKELWFFDGSPYWDWSWSTAESVS